MGCPIDIVVNKVAGSSLLKKSMRITSIVQAASTFQVISVAHLGAGKGICFCFLSLLWGLCSKFQPFIPVKHFIGWFFLLIYSQLENCVLMVQLLPWFWADCLVSQGRAVFATRSSFDPVYMFLDRFEWWVLITLLQNLSALNGLNYMFNITYGGKQCLYLHKVWPWCGDVWGNLYISYVSCHSGSFIFHE